MSTRDLRNVVRYGWDQLELEEALVDSTTMTPGHLVEETSDGYQEHSTDGGVVQRPMFAKDMRGRGFEVDPNDSDMVYADDDWIEFVIPNAGVGLTAILASGPDLNTSSNANISDGDRLVSAGDGTLRAFDGDDPDDVVAVAEEAKDNSGANAGVQALLDVEVVR